MLSIYGNTEKFKKGIYLTLTIISTRPEGKTITRSSVELAFKNALSVQRRDGCVKGPKACGQIFGISYLYAIFLRWGIITDVPVSGFHEQD